MRIRSVLSHSAQVVVEGALISLLIVGLLASTALAAKPAAGGGGGGGGSHKVSSAGPISLVMVIDADASGGPSLGDTISWDVSKSGVANPYITMTCSQNGTMVLSAYAGYYDGYMWPAARNMLLSSDAWTGGAANCKAVLYGTSTTYSFTAAG